jgi:hypothetical protein
MILNIYSQNLIYKYFGNRVFICMMCSDYWNSTGCTSTKFGHMYCPVFKSSKKIKGN